VPTAESLRDLGVLKMGSLPTTLPRSGTAATFREWVDDEIRSVIVVDPPAPPHIERHACGRDRVSCAGPTTIPTTIAIRQRRPTVIMKVRSSPVTVGRMGRKTADVFSEAWSRVTVRRLPRVLLKTHAKTIALASVSSRKSQNG
jgi:hypothetical protein